MTLQQRQWRCDEVNMGKTSPMVRGLGCNGDGDGDGDGDGNGSRAKQIVLKNVAVMSTFNASSN